MTTTTTTRESESFGFSLDNVPERDRERVEALIPNPLIAERYVSRSLNGVRDLEAFAFHMEERENIALEGPTGSAKTTAARAFAALHSLPFHAIAINGGIDPSAIWGQRVITEDRSLEWIDSDALLVVKYGGVLVADELRMMSARIAAALHEITDIRRSVTLASKEGETIKAAHPLLIVATTNPVTYAGNGLMSPAFARRFVWIDWPYLEEVERDLVKSESLLDMAHNIRSLPEVSTPVSTDTLQALERHAQGMGISYAMARFVERFTESERAGVKRACEMAAPNIAAELIEENGESAKL